MINNLSVKRRPREPTRSLLVLCIFSLVVVLCASGICRAMPTPDEETFSREVSGWDDPTKRCTVALNLNSGSLSSSSLFPSSSWSHPGASGASSSSAAPVYPKYAKELTGWLAALGPMPLLPPPPPPSSSSLSGPCLHYNGVGVGSNSAANSPYFVPLDKRNSELINSLLTLPKNNLNDVGK